MTTPTLRYAGDYGGTCTQCDEYVEFAVGIRPPADPVAMHFGPGGPQAIVVDSSELIVMTEETVELQIAFQCPLCGGLTDARIACRAMPT